jgi:hypothetical protein
MIISAAFFAITIYLTMRSSDKFAAALGGPPVLAGLKDAAKSVSGDQAKKIADMISKTERQIPHDWVETTRMRIWAGRFFLVGISLIVLSLAAALIGLLV